MATRKPIKKYALDLVDELRKDMEDVKNSTLPSVDLGEVLQVRPKIIVEPQHERAEYDEDYLMFAVAPETLNVGDLVVITRDPSHQPIITGVVDYDNPNPFDNAELNSFRADMELLRENVQHWRTSVTLDANLPTAGNTDGDLRLSLETNTVFRWDAVGGIWVTVSGASVGAYLPLAGGTLTGNLVMDTGTSVTIPDAPTNGTDATNKDYVDSEISAVSAGGLLAVTTVNSNYTIIGADRVILVDASAGNVEVRLPAGHSIGRVFEVKDRYGYAETNTISVVSDDGDTIDNSASFVLTTNLQAVTLVSDGSDWSVI